MISLSKKKKTNKGNAIIESKKCRKLILQPVVKEA